MMSEKPFENLSCSHKPAFKGDKGIRRQKVSGSIDTDSRIDSAKTIDMVKKKESSTCIRPLD